MNNVQEPPTASFPPCSAENSSDSHRTDFPTNKANKNRQTEVAPSAQRCQFTFSDGRQCRHLAKVYPQDELSPVKNVRNQRASLCIHHARRRRTPGDEVAPDAGLEALCGDLTTATNINRALAHVFLLMAQGRIAQKQAVAFGYLAQLLLQTVPGIRSEFVSAFGYHPWEQKLRTSLNARKDENAGSSQSSATQSDPPQSVAEPPGAPMPSPSDNVSMCDRTLSERIISPDYESLVSRGRDLLAGKYDSTPEGRREAKALLTELELMEPPASKPPKGARASVIEHMKRWIAQRKSPAAKTAPPMPPPLNNLGHPITIAVPPPLSADEGALHSRSESPLSSPASQPPAASFDLPSTRRPKNPQDSAGLPAPKKPPFSPQRPAPRAPDVTQTGTEHTIDWYAPASWSRTNLPDPFPSRKKKLAGQLRGMSSCRLRRLQHLQQSKFLE